MGGLQSRRRSLVTVLLVAQLVAATLATIYVVASGDPFPDAQPALLAFLAGAAGCGALAAFYRGLAIGTMSIVAPVSATGAAVPVLVGVLGGERPGPIQVAGIVLLFGIVLAAREPGGSQPSRNLHASVGLALLAAIGFGSFFVLIDAATEDGGCRVVAAVRARRRGAAARRGRARAAPRDAARRARREPAAVDRRAGLRGHGVLRARDQEGLLSIVAVVGSLYPAVTVVLARVVLAERVARSQEIGVSSRSPQSSRSAQGDSEVLAGLVQRRLGVAAVQHGGHPIARAGLRFPGRSSTNTHSGRDADPLGGELVDLGSGLRSPTSPEITTPSNSLGPPPGRSVLAPRVGEQSGSHPGGVRGDARRRPSPRRAHAGEQAVDQVLAALDLEHGGEPRLEVALGQPPTSSVEQQLARSRSSRKRSRTSSAGRPALQNSRNDTKTSLVRTPP